MKIAYFSSFPYATHRIADYSVERYTALLRRAEVDLWIDQSGCRRGSAKLQNFSITWTNPACSTSWADDAIVYHMGNSPAHRNIFPVPSRIRE